MSYQTYIGIDNGLDGALVALDREGNVIGKSVMPTSKEGKGRVIDAETLYKWIASFEAPFVLLEEAAKHSPGKLALCSTWRSFGNIEGVLKVTQIPYGVIRPQKWQGSYWKPRTKDPEYNTKSEALKQALIYWPDESWLPSPRHRKAHDGMIDAALIALYASTN